MHAASSLHRRAAWLALCAMVFGSLAPSISKLLAAAQGEGTAWVEICSAQGIKRIALDASGTKSPDGHADRDAHCGYCLLLQHCPVLHTPYQLWVALEGASTERLPIGSGTTTVPTRFTRDAHPTRAPPASS